MYRIIEEIGTITKESNFYIQKRYRFLYWTWWEKLKVYHPGCDTSLDYSYSTYASAKRDFDKLNDKIEIKIYDDNNSNV